MWINISISHRVSKAKTPFTRVSRIPIGCQPRSIACSTPSTRTKRCAVLYVKYNVSISRVTADIAPRRERAAVTKHYCLVQPTSSPSRAALYNERPVARSLRWPLYAAARSKRLLYAASQAATAREPAPGHAKGDKTAIQAFFLCVCDAVCRNPAPCSLPPVSPLPTTPPAAPSSCAEAL